SKEPALRAAAVEAVYALSATRDGGLTEFQTKRALPALVKAYRAEPPGSLRDRLAEAVCDIGGEKNWKVVSGTPRGLVFVLRQFGHDGRQFSFYLERRCGSDLVYERPTLVLERLDAGGKVVETREQPLPTTDMRKPWEDGWDNSPHLGVTV